jgi:hypothetical protein
MIYVVEVPEQGDPKAWFAYDDDDLARKVAASDAREPWEIYDEITPRSLLEAVGHAELDEAARTAFPAICTLGDQHGWETALYRADYLLGHGVLSAQAVTPRAAWAAALEARPGSTWIYWDDSQALAAFEGADPRLQDKSRWRAKQALYEQLLALEILADNN